ncbi:hypothetical protein [Derxia lacustris]|uniref:hypothetical protein n=1 Tax=Derxia lacustris TaxID=764842 RepID=UPI00111C3A0C|nr:hypothetical protein [Derxia lacustris]
MKRNAWARAVALSALTLAGGAGAGLAQAQVVCTQAGAATVCDGQTGYHRRYLPGGGNGSTVVTRADGSSTTITRVGGATLINNGPGQGTTTVTRIGTTTLITQPDGSSTTVSRVGVTTFVTESGPQPAPAPEAPAKP